AHETPQPPVFLAHCRVELIGQFQGQLEREYEVLDVGEVAKTMASGETRSELELDERAKGHDKDALDLDRDLGGGGTRDRLGLAIARLPARGDAPARPRAFAVEERLPPTTDGAHVAAPDALSLDEPLQRGLDTCLLHEELLGLAQALDSGTFGSRHVCSMPMRGVVAIAGRL